MVAPRAIAAIVALVLGLAVGYGIALTVEGARSATPSTSEPGDGTVSWLFVITAGSGTFSDNGSGDLTVTFEDMKERVVMFSDRPARVTGDMPLEGFAALWNEGGTFAQDPPNADLEFVTSTGEQRGRTVELTGVILNGGLTFSARALEGAGLVEQASTTTSFTDATLFIDAWDPKGACIDASDQASCGTGYFDGYDAGFGSTGPNPGEVCGTVANEVDCVTGYKTGYRDGANDARNAPIPNT